MSSATTEMDSWYGIRQVYPTEDRPLPKGKQIVLDVVCVHGLNGHAMRSFTHPTTHVFWPQDLLPVEVPTARVLTYGYDASSESTAMGQSILDLAMQLVSDLRDVRREKDERDRDILFICHSLGGILVKKVILLHLTAADLKAVQQSMAAIFFMGTPHCGSSLASIGSVVAKVASTLIDAPRNLINMLKKDSYALYDISREFSVVAADLGLRLTTFYELNPYSRPFWAAPARIVVDKRSAILGLPDEEIIAVHGHHGELCKFASAEDPKFRPVWIRIENFSQQAEERLRARKGGLKDVGGPLDDQTQSEQHVEVAFLSSENTLLPSPTVGTTNCYWRVPFLPCASFTGRQSLLQRMQNHFTDPFEERQRRFSIYGLGGSGKTQLALTYAVRNRARYAGVFFLDADTETSLHEDFEKIYEDLQLGSPMDKTEAVKRHLDEYSSATWLLIFDNADDLEAYDLSGYFPLSENVHVIITSRDYASYELASEGLHLEKMDPEESKSLLVSRAGLTQPTEGTLRDVEAVLEQLSYLPLAIDQAGAYMRARNCSPAAYLRRFETERERVLRFSPKLSSYKKSVITAWEVSFMRLETDAPRAAKLLLLFSYLDYRRVSERMLLGIAEPVIKIDADGNPRSVTAEENGIGVELIELIADRDTYEEAIEKLLSFSLIRQHVETSGTEDLRVFSVHPLVAYCTQSRIVQAIKRESAEQAICILSHAFPEWSTNFSVVEFGRLTRSHLTRCLSYIDQPETFGSNLADHARKLLLIVWSVRTVQLFNMRPDKTDAERKMLSTAFALATKYGDAYISVAAASVHYRHFDREESERLCDDYLREHKLQEGRHPGNPEHGGRFNAALGDLVIFRACLRRDLGRGDDPSALFHAWSPINPGSPSILERNAKWWRDRTVGSQYMAIGKLEEAERILRAHVTEFSKLNFTGTDEHLEGACFLADCHYVQKQWEKAEAVLQDPIKRAQEIGRDAMAWHVLSAEIRFQEILVCSGKYAEATARILRFNSQLHEMALPEFTIGPMFATWCLLAQIAHEQNRWLEAKENWTKALGLGQAMGWPDGPWMNLARCSLDTILYEAKNEVLDDKTFQAWRDALRIGHDNAEGGRGIQLLHGMGDEWRDRLEARLHSIL